MHNHHNTTQPWTTIAPFIVSITAVAIAILGETLKNIFIKPSLFFKEVGTIPQEKYDMYRILVKNNGWSAAKNVRASIVFVDKILPLPIPLIWTYDDKDTRDISRGESVYLDVFIFDRLNRVYEFYSKIAGRIYLPEYKLDVQKKTKIKISFFEENTALGLVLLELDPIEKKLKILNN